MILLLLTAVLAVALCLITLVQALFMDSMRLRAREFPMLDLFREHLQERIGLRDERGALAFSIAKHTALMLVALLCFAISVDGGSATWGVFLEAAFVAWLLILFSTYIAPHILYRRTQGHWLLKLAPALRLLAKAMLPLTAVLAFFQSLMELAQPEAPEEETSATEDIDALIAAGAEGGIIEETDRKLIQSVVAFGDKTVREVMTPRPNIVAIEGSRTLEDLRNLVINEQYSRIPVYIATIDQIEGFVHVRDMFELDEDERLRRKVTELMRPVRLVPETKSVSELLREMQGDGAHMSIVVDEYGNTAGLVTMEDLVEEILGEIRDEHEPERDVTQESDGAFVVAGSLDVDRLQDLFDFRTDEDTHSTTVGGLVTEWLGHVPHAGETLQHDGLRIEVLAANDLRVEQVRLSRAEPQPEAEPVTSPGELPRGV